MLEWYSYEEVRSQFILQRPRLPSDIGKQTDCFIDPNEDENPPRLAPAPYSSPVLSYVAMMATSCLHTKVGIGGLVHPLLSKPSQLSHPPRWHHLLGPCSCVKFSWMLLDRGRAGVRQRLQKGQCSRQRRAGDPPACGLPLHSKCCRFRNVMDLLIGAPCSSRFRSFDVVPSTTLPRASAI